MYVRYHTQRKDLYRRVIVILNLKNSSLSDSPLEPRMQDNTEIGCSLKRHFRLLEDAVERP